MKKIAFRCFTVGIGVLLALAAVEAGLRVSNVWVGRHSDMMFAIIGHDPALGWKMKPAINEKIDLVDVEDIPVRSNSEGFWDREFTVHKPAGIRRAAFLGDSFTWGMGVGEDERFSNLVASLVDDLEALNFGMPGYGADQSLLVWRHVVQQYRPDLVVLTVYQNDYVDNTCLVRFGRRKPYFEVSAEGSLELRGVPVESTDFWDDGVFNRAAPPYESLFQQPTQKRSRLAHWLAKNSDLARYVYTLTKRSSVESVQADAGASPATTEAANPKLSPAEEVQLNLMTVLVERLASEASSAGARFVVVLAGDPIPQFQWQKVLFDRAGVAWIDATTESIAARTQGQGVYYTYSRHWTPAAHRAVAELLAERLKQTGAEPGGGRRPGDGG